MPSPPKTTTISTFFTYSLCSITVKFSFLLFEDLSNGIDNEALNLMINSISNLDINLYIDKTSNNKNKNFTVLEHEEFVKKVDIVVVFGGDGTLLNAARKYLNYDIPILGINMGNVGFLTDISTDNFEKTIKEVLDLSLIHI